MVSDRGNVKRVAPAFRHPHVGQLKPFLDPTTGYLKVRLHRLGMRPTRPVHVLVCVAFHGPRPAKADVRHCDGDKFNNAATNLTWGSRRELPGRGYAGPGREPVQTNPTIGVESER